MALLIVSLAEPKSEGNRGHAPVRQNVNAGFGIMRPFGRADDTFALAAGDGQEVDGSRGDDAIETFYRVQLTPHTPS